MRSVLPLVTLCLILASCNDKQAATTTPPTVYVAPPGTPFSDALGAVAGEQNRPSRLTTLAVTAPAVTSGGGIVRTFQATINATVTTSVAGMPDQVANSPAGLQASFLIQGGNIRTRVDYPASAFPDNQARIVTYNKATGVAKVLFAGTLAVDPSVNPADVAGMLQGQQDFAAQQIDAAKPFTKVGLTEFQNKAVAAGATATPATISAQGLSTAQVTKSFSMSTGAVQQSTLTYDSATQAVSKIRTVVEDAKTKQDVTTNISYAPVTDLVNVTIPYRMESTQTVTLKSTLQTVSINQAVNYDTIRLNTLSDAYFLVGGS